jgi:succinyl-diaminopimelate desuccinylase
MTGASVVTFNTSDSSASTTRAKQSKYFPLTPVKDRIHTMPRLLISAFLTLLAISATCLGQDTHERAEQARKIYKEKYSSKLVPMLTEALRFPTVEGNTDARDRQQKWIQSVGTELGFTVRNAGLITEVELPAAASAPVLGLVVHGDVQPVNEAEWAFPPFAGTEKNGVVYGRGSADDKGGLVQALLAMAALRDSNAPRTHTIRLLVGSDEESTNLDVTSYLKSHPAPELSLVLDSAFPGVVGEKAWSAFTVTAEDPYTLKPQAAQNTGFALVKLDAGLAASIVPSEAVAVLEWHGSKQELDRAVKALRGTDPPAGYKLSVESHDTTVTVTARGHSAHAGMNIEGGRNALVYLGKALHGKLLPSQAADLLLFAEESGRDIYGSGLGLTTNHPLWGHNAVNVATIKPTKDHPESLTLTTNIRALPSLWGEPLHAFLNKQLATFNSAHGEQFVSGGFFADPPLVFDPNAKLVKKLMADYERATGEKVPPAISGGGTYAKRLPHSIAFGMWFPGKPYPGHDVDEQITVVDLNRGVDVLIEALADIATSEPIPEPFKP